MMSFFFNVQHPSDLSGNDTSAQVGVVTGVDWSTLDPMTKDLSVPSTDEEKLSVRFSQRGISSTW